MGLFVPSSLCPFPYRIFLLLFCMPIISLSCVLSRHVSGGMVSGKQRLVPVGLATSGSRATVLACPQVKGAWIIKVLPHGGIATNKEEKLCKAIGLAQGRGAQLTAGETWAACPFESHLPGEGSGVRKATDLSQNRDFGLTWKQSA